MAFYAHSTQRRDHSDWQGLAEHLNGVGERASVHAEAFGGQVMARVAGQLHDLGKYTEKFRHAWQATRPGWTMRPGVHGKPASCIAVAERCWPMALPGITRGWLMDAATI